jgi:hypothetical protein
MDLTTRKYRFIEQFMKIANPEKIKRLEALLKEELASDEEIVAYTVVGEPLNAAQYKKRVLEADAAIDRGEFITHEDLKRKVKEWGK